MGPRDGNAKLDVTSNYIELKAVEWSEMMQQNLLVGSLEALQQSEKNQRHRNQLGEHQKSRTARLLPSAAKRLSEMKTE